MQPNNMDPRFMGQQMMPPNYMSQMQQQFGQMNMNPNYKGQQYKQGFKQPNKGWARSNQNKGPDPTSSQGLELAKKHNTDLETINDKELTIPEDAKFYVIKS